MIRHADSLSVSLYVDPYCSFCTHRLVFSFSQFCSVKHVCVWERERASVLWCCLYLVDVFCFTSCGCWAVVDVLWLMCLRGQTRCPAIGRRWSSTTSTLAWVTVWVACSPASSMPTPTTAGVASSPFTTSETLFSSVSTGIVIFHACKRWVLFLYLEFAFWHCHILPLKWLRQDWVSSMPDEAIGKSDPCASSRGCS